MAIPKINGSTAMLKSMIEFGVNVIKPFASLGGKQLQRGGKGANELLKLSGDSLKALAKMKKGLK